MFGFLLIHTLIGTLATVGIFGQSLVQANFEQLSFANDATKSKESVS